MVFGTWKCGVRFPSRSCLRCVCQRASWEICLVDGECCIKIKCCVLLQRVKRLDKQKRQKQRVVYFTHTRTRKSHKANAAHWSQLKHPAVSRMVIISRHHLSLLFGSAAADGNKRNGPLSTSQKQYLYFASHAALFSFSFLSSHKTFSFAFTLSPNDQWDAGGENGR